jgi:hypothetical protein
LTLRGKIQLDAKTSGAANVQVQVHLTTDWANDRDKAAEFMGPKMEIVK